MGKVYKNKKNKNKISYNCSKTFVLFTCCGTFGSSNSEVFKYIEILKILGLIDRKNE